MKYVAGDLKFILWWNGNYTQLRPASSCSCFASLNCNCNIMYRLCSPIIILTPCLHTDMGLKGLMGVFSPSPSMSLLVVPSWPLCRETCLWKIKITNKLCITCSFDGAFVQRLHIPQHFFTDSLNFLCTFSTKIFLLKQNTATKE